MRSFLSAALSMGPKPPTPISPRSFGALWASQLPRNNPDRMSESAIAELRELQLLLDGLDEAFDRKSWHGTNLRGSVRGVAVKEALWRPGPGRHNIWELMLHAAYWKYVVRRRITGEKRGSFLLKG